MGLRGPKPTPTATLKARGSWRADVNADEPKASIGAPAIPPLLSPEARRVWRRIVPKIAPGVLSLDNGQTLARYCHGLVRWWKLAAWLDSNDDTYTVTDQLGNVRILRHPHVITYEKLSRELSRLEADFGLTPAARSRIQAGGGNVKAEDQTVIPKLRLAQ